VASHDLQEPLRKIQSFSNLLMEEYYDRLDENAKIYIDRIVHSSSRMRILINDLLSFSRVSTHARPFSIVNLHTIVNDVLADLETIINEKSATVKVSILPIIEADTLQMRQLFQNLISNALKFQKNGAKPVITIYSKPVMEKKRFKSKLVKAHAIYVQDNGIGFDEKYISKIFTIFERLHGKHE